MPHAVGAVFYSSSLEVYFVVACLAGIMLGPILFFRGFRMLRFKRMILNTPRSRIHSASMGLVEVTGTPVGPYVLSAPMTGDPCYYYRVQAWQWEPSGNNSHTWRPVLDERLYVPFFLEDRTGRVLVDPQGADLDVHRSFSDEIGASFFRTNGLLPPHIKEFLLKRGLVPYEKIKVQEQIIPQGFPLFVFGTLGENPALSSGFARPRAGSSASVSLHFPGGACTGAFTVDTSVGGSLSARGASMVAEVLNHLPGVQVETTEIQMPTNAATPTAIPEQDAAKGNRQDVPLPAYAFPKSAQPSSDKSAFGDFDLRSSVAISKGEGNQPFAISGHSQSELVGKLSWKSVAYIWGGPVMVLGGLYLLMAYLRWIR
jgi:E3 Ubiquitin ligase